jgi:hypothetical protein
MKWGEVEAAGIDSIVHVINDGAWAAFALWHHDGGSFLRWGS